jgi:endonuclease III
MKENQRAEMFARFAHANPHPATELRYRSPFELLVAVILSAQATDKSVNAATGPLYAHANTPAQILALGEAGLTEYIRTIGLFRTKAKNVIATCKLLIERHGGDVPDSREALEELPGVGRKTANVMLNTVFGQPTIAVDTHIFRLANRTGLAPGKTPLEVEQKLLRNVPAKYLQHAHHWLILHGRYVCLARKPRCAQCAIEPLCEFKKKELGAQDKTAPAQNKPARRRAGKPKQKRRGKPRLL